MILNQFNKNMRGNLLLVIIIINVILITSCIKQNKQVPPIIYKTPPSLPPSLNAYGKLLDVSRVNGLTVLKIQAEIVNWERYSNIVQGKLNRYWKKNPEILKKLNF